MAAITKRLLHLRPNHHLHPYPLHHFSSSSDTNSSSAVPQPQHQHDSETTTPKQSTFSSYYDDVKASLQKEPPPHNRHQSPPRPLSFSNRTHPQPPPPSQTASLEEIRRNLSDFRLRTAAPPPSSSPGQYISIQELYKRNVDSKADESATSSDPQSPAGGGKRPFDAIRESLRQLKSTSPAAARNRNDSSGKPIDPVSLSRFKETLKMKVESNANLGSGIFTGGSERHRNVDDNVGRTNFLRMYNHQDLGKKLKMLRPEKKKGQWFSLQELNERLAKLREIEEKESESMIGIEGFTKDLRDGLLKLTMSNTAKAKEAKARKDTLQGLYVLGHPGGTPSFMLSPPKEELVEKYFHPDNMSSAEKLKLELKRVRDEFKMSESDCGSARVQVAQLTTKIKHLSNVLQKKDKHSRKGLQEMVQRRKKLLKYLRRTDWDSYCLVLSKLGLRDNPDIKA
ncbi:hypothetical protein BUALT_Bualt02G0105900 [Buddleja alternifolia]|uniref:Small ribosomal subunit protein uS15c n=1 Tax=Buddleja alternifolia TaxID=168488 RepID=A0AAV6Y7R5_9LAMI|nr:hypothetical protein BUALT_Bualt02G0105900 [Buddleja alternifolia]